MPALIMSAIKIKIHKQFRPRLIQLYNHYIEQLRPIAGHVGSVLRERHREPNTWWLICFWSTPEDMHQHFSSAMMVTLINTLSVVSSSLGFLAYPKVKGHIDGA